MCRRVKNIFKYSLPTGFLFVTDTEHVKFMCIFPVLPLRCRRSNDLKAHKVP